MEPAFIAEIIKPRAPVFTSLTRDRPAAGHSESAGSTQPQVHLAYLRVWRRFTLERPPAKHRAHVRESMAP